MTVRELAYLRDRVARAQIPADEMPADRAEHRPTVRRQRARWQATRGWRLAYCAYCGKHIRGQGGTFTAGLTCYEHADLPALDGRYTRGRMAA